MQYGSAYEHPIVLQDSHVEQSMLCDRETFTTHAFCLRAQNCQHTRELHTCFHCKALLLLCSLAYERFFHTSTTNNVQVCLWGRQLSVYRFPQTACTRIFSATQGLYHSSLSSSIRVATLCHLQTLIQPHLGSQYSLRGPLAVVPCLRCRCISSSSGNSSHR